MDIVFILLPTALLLGGIGVMWMLWAVQTDQFDDMEGPAQRILFEDDKEMIPGNDHETESHPGKEE
ncbi:MAG: cbb3-type cytochrome oxidase assembly protein CcoS [Magnetococcales bacterium]|nr:cbb3-type cytochrome oxidase assembly protein CcoS [Magnetococcales bacterium]MBF0420180.1 cbb3-type cytochrome oxidase assembly protein CcoS [Magnetococcales bacterium]